MPDTAYLFLDSETTGTNRYNDQIWQLSWSLETKDRLFADRDFNVQHTSNPTQWVLDNTLYTKKHSEPQDTRQVVLKQLMNDILAAAPLPVHLVGANPTFDDYFMHKLTWGVPSATLKYHYRLIDIETLVMAELNLDAPAGLRNCLELLNLPPAVEAMHDARVDRTLTRDIFWYLKEQRTIRAANAKAALA